MKSLNINGVDLTAHIKDIQFEPPERPFESLQPLKSFSGTLSGTWNDEIKCGCCQEPIVTSKGIAIAEYMGSGKVLVCFECGLALRGHGLDS